MPSYVSLRGPYGEYLQQRAFAHEITQTIAGASRNITLQMSRHSREAIASIDALTRENIRIARGQNDLQEHLLWEVGATREAIDRLNATFEWGFSTLIAQVGSLGQSLDELVRTAQTPNRTRAYEYYNDSREAFSRQHFPEALSAIEKALSGDSESTTGYRLDWRFYHQKALVHLGGPGENHKHLNLEHAVECAVKAVEYASSAGDLTGASVSALTASWAAYCRKAHPGAHHLQSELTGAFDWAQRAITFDRENPEAHFQAAKILMASGKTHQSIPFLLDAVRLDRRYVLRAADDGDFVAHEAVVRDAFERFRSDLAAETADRLRESLTDSSFWSAILDSRLKRTGEWLAVANALLNDTSSVLLLDLIQLAEWRRRRVAGVALGRTWDMDLLSEVLKACASLEAVTDVVVHFASKRWDFRPIDARKVVGCLEQFAREEDHKVVAILSKGYGIASKSIAAGAFCFEAKRRLREQPENWSVFLGLMGIDSRRDVVQEFQSLEQSTYISHDTRDSLRQALAAWYAPLIPNIERLIVGAGTEAAAKKKRSAVAIFWWFVWAAISTFGAYMAMNHAGDDTSTIVLYFIVIGLWLGFFRAIDAGKIEARQEAICAQRKQEADGWANVLRKDLFEVVGSHREMVVG